MSNHTLRALILGSSIFCSLSANALECSALAAVALPDVQITAAEALPAGVLDQGVRTPLALPARCRIAATLSPSDDSAIAMELWLPQEWNGKFLAVGNGGWAGSISYSAMALGLQAGYAVASNDTGHVGDTAEFAVGHPEKVIDFGWRAMHEMVVNAKSLIERHYETAIRLSYYQGCSTGGRQGMMAAQMFPADFDAIIAGAPVYNQLALNAAQLHDMKNLLEHREMALSQDKVNSLHQAVLAACEVHDGVADGFLNNPLACTFDPRVLACAAGNDADCLSAGETQAVLNAYNGVFSASGAQLYPGHARGFELGWRIPAEGSALPGLQTGATQYLLHEDAAWDWREFDIERDLAAVREKAGFIEALETDLSEFKARGGKILFYHGWNDPGPSPLNTIAYYDAALATTAAEQNDWMRLFMMPGMGHCAGGIGPDQADFLGTMEAWVEQGIVPERITAARIREGRVDMTRPLCAHPAVATWDGKGNADDAASYACDAPDSD